MPLQNPVRARARADYDTNLVSINHSAIAGLPSPSNLEPMRPLLAGTPLAGRQWLSAAFLVAMDSLNYQFWEREPDGALRRYSVGGQVGAWAMQGAFLSAWLEAMGEVSTGWTAERLAVERAVAGLQARLAVDGVGGIFGDIPEARSRAAILHEVLNARLLMLVSGGLAGSGTSSGVLGLREAELLAVTFPEAYGDPYLKKAQLTLMFVAAELRAVGWPVRLDVTAAADYQLPKVLRALGVLEYSQYLAALVDGGALITEDSAEERAIRAATVLACDALAAHFGVGVDAVDSWLWLQRNVAKEANFHLTVTTRY